MIRYGLLSIDKNYRLRKMKKILHAIKPDVVIAVLPSWGPLIYGAKGNLNFKVIGTDHNAYELPEGVRMSDAQMFYKFEFNKRFDAVTVLTEADKKVVQGKLKNVSVLPNPLTFTPIDKVPSKKKIVMAAGRLDVWYIKGFDVLIKAWAIVSQKHADWELYISGESNKTSERLYIEKLIREYNVQQTIRLIGYSDRIKELYKEASIFVLSSRYEGFGMVLTEAMSQGCACVACDFKGRQREIIRDSSEGIICPPDNVTELADAIDNMISDNDYRISVQNRSVERSKDFSLDKIMEKWSMIFNKIFN